MDFVRRLRLRVQKQGCIHDHKPQIVAFVRHSKGVAEGQKNGSLYNVQTDSVLIKSPIRC